MANTDDPQKLAEILEALKATTPLGKSLDYAQIWDRWEELVGSELGARSHPLKVKRGVLTVAAASPVWIHKFSYQKSTIIAKINDILVTDPVEDIFLTLPSEEDVPRPQDGAS